MTPQHPGAENPLLRILGPVSISMFYVMSSRHCR